MSDDHAPAGLFSRNFYERLTPVRKVLFWAAFVLFTGLSGVLGARLIFRLLGL